MADYKSLSIDEVAVSPSRLDTFTAVNNIRRFQQHVVSEFSTTMATGRIPFADRQRSVTEEDLFGDGTANRPDSKTDAEITDGVIDGLSKELEKANTSVGGEIDLPIFSMFAHFSSSGSESNEKKSTEEDINMRKEMLLEQTNPESSDYKMRYSSKRSISDVHEKRRTYGNSADVEVFEDYDENEEETKTRQIRKSNSLPGRVESSLSPVPSPNNSGDHSSDSHKSSMEKSLEKKISLEGPSAKPAIKTSDSQRPKLQRRVSFMDDCTDNPNSQKVCKTPTEERRHTFRSSGYGTGSGTSKESFDKNDTKRKMSQNSQALSDVWISQESEKVPNENDTSMKDSHTSYVANFEVKSKTGVTPNKSNDFGELNGSKELVDTLGKHSSQSIQGKGNLSCEDNFAHNLHNSGVFQRLKSKDEGVSTTDFTYRKTCGPQSYGNMPHFSTLGESYQMGPSTVALVMNEDQKNINAVISKYCCSTNSSSPGSAPCTGISEASFFKVCPSQDVENLERLVLHYSPKEILRQLHEESPSPCSPSPTPNTVENFRKKCAFFSENFNAVNLLEASRCDDENCDRIFCTMLNKVLDTIGSDMLDSDQIELRNYFYQALFTHNTQCDEVKCPVRFCQDINEWRKKSSDSFCVETMGNIIQDYVTSPCMNVVLENKCSLMMLQKTGKKTDIVDFQTCIPLFPLGKFGIDVVCKDMETDSIVVISKYPMMDYKHQLSLYTRIVDLTHPHIVKQLWLLEYEERIQVCTVLTTGGNLKDYLTSVELLPWQLAVVYMRQILSAISYLHSDTYGVVYLYWCAENLLFSDCQRRVLQISNFSLACPQGCKLDYGSLKSCLPYSICPPELIKDNIVSFQSDGWGAGCILYQMLTGSSYLHELRHDNQSDVHNKVRQGTRPDLTGFKPELTEILESWWQVNKDKRMSIDMTLRKLNKISLKVP